MTNIDRATRYSLLMLIKGMVRNGLYLEHMHSGEDTFMIFSDEQHEIGVTVKIEVEEK